MLDEHKDLHEYENSAKKETMFYDFMFFSLEKLQLQFFLFSCEKKTYKFKVKLMRFIFWWFFKDLL